MYIKFLNFYLPQTIGYFFPFYLVYYLTIAFLIGIAISILMFCFRKKQNIKKFFLSSYFFIVFLMQIYSTYSCYSSFKISEQHLNFWATITFFLVFGAIFLIYYIPTLGILLADFIITQTLIGNKGDNK